jgi:hypothetical protein
VVLISLYTYYIGARERVNVDELECDARHINKGKRCVEMKQRRWNTLFPQQALSKPNYTVRFLGLVETIIDNAYSVTVKRSDVTPSSP